MTDIYSSGEYLEKTRTWHAEDSPWKASQIYRILERNDIKPARVAEVGCGAGVILDELSRKPRLQETRFAGYDVSPQAIELCQRIDNDRITFQCEDPLIGDAAIADVLLVIDVFEHVPDYLGFIDQCRAKAEYKIYHIPLDIHVSSVLRNTVHVGRYTLGHLHYFCADTALATLRDTGHEIVDSFYTNAAMGLFRLHPSVKRAVANLPRWIISRLSTALSARLLGGYSLLVLAK